MQYNDYYALIQDAKKCNTTKQLLSEYGYPADFEGTPEQLVKILNLAFAIKSKDIKAIAKTIDLTVKALCGYIGINYRTAEAWTSGRSSPTDYIVLMIGYIVINEALQD